MRSIVSGLRESEAALNATWFLSPSLCAVLFPVYESQRQLWMRRDFFLHHYAQYSFQNMRVRGSFECDVVSFSVIMLSILSGVRESEAALNATYFLSPSLCAVFFPACEGQRQLWMRRDLFIRHYAQYSFQHMRVRGNFECDVVSFSVIIRRILSGVREPTGSFECDVLSFSVIMLSILSGVRESEAALNATCFLSPSLCAVFFPAYESQRQHGFYVAKYPEFWMQRGFCPRHYAQYSCICAASIRSHRLPRATSTPVHHLTSSGIFSCHNQCNSLHRKT
jgi:glycerol uptake facilitator-like aquaporin